MDKNPRKLPVRDGKKWEGTANPLKSLGGCNFRKGNYLRFCQESVSQCGGQEFDPPNKKDAEAYLNTTLTQIRAGTFVEPVKLTLNEYLDKWLATAAKARVRERTHVDYSEKLR